VNVYYFRAENKIDKQELMFLMTSDVVTDNNIPISGGPNWLNDNCWDKLCRLNTMRAFNGRYIIY